MVEHVLPPPRCISENCVRPPRPFVPSPVYCLPESTEVLLNFDNKHLNLKESTWKCSVIHLFIVGIFSYNTKSGMQRDGARCFEKNTNALFSAKGSN